MRDFNPTILNSLRKQGYPFVLYYNMEHFAFVIPLRETCETNDASYIVPIHDDLLAEMASGVDEFSIYVFS